ncbi:hypothetical protein [Pannonibacter phragmitetus]|uniref:hypothetical protein n=1 Tax=Pannonibacter phragmitetus TaxID=121719 RepID=UPI0009DA4EFB|nr:hypothetical protein [Pannonibacter phragmitetus]
MIVGERICEFRFRSFFMSGSLVREMLVLYFRFSKSGWISLDLGEGILRILPVESEPKLLDLNAIHDDFAYPVQKSDELNRYLGKELIAVYKYVIPNVEDGCVGAYLDFGDIGFSVLEHEDKLSIIDGIFANSGNLSLCKIYL